MKFKRYIILLPISLVVLSYPVFVHFRIIEHSAAPFALMVILIMLSINIKFWYMALTLVGVTGLSVALLFTDQVANLYFLPPIAINFFVGTLFLNSLRKNNVPLIVNYKKIIEGHITPEERQYAWILTILWALVLYLMMLESIVLSIFFSYEIWSLFTNIVNYLILALMFVGEYYVRVRLFPNKKHMSFWEFIIRLRSVKLKTIVM